MTNQSTDVLIIGGGVIGLAAAYYLLDLGKSVRVVEMDQVGSGSSQANCGLITPSHAPPLAVPGVAAKALRWMFNPRSPFYLKPTLRPSTLSWFLKFAARANARDMVQSLAGRGAHLFRFRYCWSHYWCCIITKWRC